MNAREALIALNLIEGIGPIRVRKLLDYFKTPEAVLSAPIGVLERIPGLTSEVAHSLHHWEESVDLQGELRRIKENDCWVVTGDDELYPKLLKHIYDPPIVLYVRGSLTQNDGSGGVAVVGSRQTTHYGRETARRLSRDLARSGVTVVSGGARGIDTAAHHGALEGGGRTVAVLGTGINHVYPAENAQLFERITSNGALITQFPFNRPGDRQSFPIRNRIVAGMTLGCVVVEAALTSGALITCNMALDNGRSVFSVPGRIDSPRSKGCHELIKRGSKLCENVEDILCEFEYLFPPSNHPVRALSQSSSTTTTPATQRSYAESRPHSKSPSQSNLKTSGKLQRREPLVKLDVTQLEGAEQKIFSLLSEQEDLDLDEIVRAGGLTSAEVATGLLKLEMKKAVVRLPGRRFAVLS